MSELVAVGVLTEKRPNPKNRKKIIKQHFGVTIAKKPVTPVPVTVSGSKIKFSEDNELKISKKKRF